MGVLLHNILDWSEAWAPLVPLIVLSRRKEQPDYLKPVVLYIWFALVTNTLIDVCWKFRNVIPVPWNSNNWLYNLHSLVRLWLFSRFFILLDHPFLRRLKRLAPLLFFGFAIADFSCCEKFFDYFNLSSRLLAIEAGLLLFYCLQYYFYKVKEDEELGRSHPDFWVVTGLGIYMAINFFIFLLYKELSVYYTRFAVDIWSVHNLSYILLHLFLAKALAEGRQPL